MNDLIIKNKVVKYLDIIFSYILVIMIILISFSNIYKPLKNNNISSLIIEISLILNLFYAFSKKTIYIRINKKLAIYLFSNLLLIIYMLSIYVTGRNRLIYIIAIGKCVGIVFLGYGIDVYKKGFIIVCKTYVISIFFVSIYYLAFIYNTSGYYFFALKNSIAPMIVASCLMILFMGSFIFNRRFIYIFILLVQLYTLFSMHSRASILALLITLMLFIICSIFKKIFFYNSMKLKKNRLYMIIIFVLMFPIFIPKVYSFVSAALRIDYLLEYGIESYSASRINMFQNGLNAFKSSLFVGIKSGPDIESFFIDTLVYSGLFGLLLFIIQFLLIIKFIVKSNVNKKVLNATLYIFISLLVNSFFERGGPFIPGTSHFINWFLIGYIFNSKNKYFIHKGVF